VADQDEFVHGVRLAIDEQMVGVRDCRAGAQQGVAEFYNPRPRTKRPACP